MATPVFAGSKKDIETISKAVSFMSGSAHGAVEKVVIFDFENVDSKVNLTRKKVENSAASSAASMVLFLAGGSNVAYDTAIVNVKESSGVSVSMDMECVDACVLVVRTKPTIDIFVGNKASDTTGVSSVAAFVMMVTKKINNNSGIFL